jgi:maleamate amidohydrolase
METRCWEAFLTKQDKEVISRWPLRKIGFGKNPSLILVDLYRAVFGDKPEPLNIAIESWPYSCGLAGWNSIPQIKKLLNAARKTAMPIIHTTGLYPEDTGIEEWQNRKAGANQVEPDLSKPDRFRYEFVPELKPLQGEAIFRKSAPSAFSCTTLLAHLNSRGVDTIIVAGETTSGCVRATVVDGRSYSYRVIVPEECVFDRTEASHAINLFDMNQKYADVLPNSEVLEYLGSIGKNRLRRKKSSRDSYR